MNTYAKTTAQIRVQ